MTKWSMDNWFKAHKYNWIKTKNGTYYWEAFIQGDFQTGELTPEGKIIWHEKKLFSEIKKELDKQNEQYYNETIKRKGDKNNGQMDNLLVGN